jgi:hypothetical protein
MFKSLSPIIANRIVDRLSGTALKARARKAVMQYRKHQTPVTEAAALTAINLLDDNMQADLRSAARI